MPLNIQRLRKLEEDCGRKMLVPCRPIDVVNDISINFEDLDKNFELCDLIEVCITVFPCC